jgi:RNA polymerase sigma-70 factor (ECF subfamily)
MTHLDGNAMAALMSAAQSGDKEAYRVVLEAVQRWSKQFFRYRVAPAIVDDLVQETLLAIHQKRHTYDPLQPFGAWLAAIARYKWADYLREHYRRAEMELPVDIPLEVAPEEDWYDSFSLHSLLQQLKPAQAAAIRLLKLQGYSVQETARLTGQSEVQVRVNIHRGIKRMLTLIE